MNRKVYMSCNVNDDGSIDLMKIWREEDGGDLLTVDEWEIFKTDMIDRLPGLIDTQAGHESRIAAQQ